jgi:hypothetical protein
MEDGIKQEVITNDHEHARSGSGREAASARASMCENESESMAEPVTRHAINPDIHEFQHLLSGIDSLDLGLYVEWRSDWKRRLKVMDKMKQKSRREGDQIVSMPSGREFIFKPGGKGENYRFHLQFEAYHLFIGKAAQPKSSPNVYLSITAKTLWLDGIDKALSWIAEDLKIIGGGSIKFIQVSRVDLCCDFLIPGGLSYEFLKAHKITRSINGRIFFGHDQLQTCYIGDAKSPTELRIYNKGLEVKQEGTKLWFLDLWKRETPDDIWRIEYQLRRDALKKSGINSIDDLREKQTALWSYLSKRFFSLRLPDNEKAERRTIHPFWSEVQESFGQNIPGNEIHRICKQDAITPIEWYLSHIDGCLSSLASFKGITNRNDAIHELHKLLQKRNNEEEFKTACIKKAIQRGTLIER